MGGAGLLNHVRVTEHVQQSGVEPVTKISHACACASAAAHDTA